MLSSKKLIGRGGIFQQDNAPSHTSQVTKVSFTRNETKLMEWSPQSPDLNPIENLWAKTERRMTACISQEI
jgi:transposase